VTLHDPEGLCIYVRDLVAHKERIEEIGRTYREAFGAQTLVEVDAWAII